MPTIEHAEKLTHIFGEWPSFHDAEVVCLILDRSGPEAPTLEAQIHVFAVTSDLDATGHYVLANHTLITLRFTEVALLGLDGFNRQNVLFELLITDLAPSTHDGRRLLVKMDASYGIGAAFECVRAVVTDVRPYAYEQTRATT